MKQAVNESGETPVFGAHQKMLAQESVTADDFVTKADITGLRNLLILAHRRERNLVDTMGTLCSLYSDKAVTLPIENENSIASMRDVALAAIGLAKAAFDRDAS